MSMDVFKSFKIAIKLKLGKQIKCVNSDKGSEYYSRYNETGRNPSLFAKYLQEYGIKAYYTMSRIPNQNGCRVQKLNVHGYGKV